MALRAYWGHACFRRRALHQAWAARPPLHWPYGPPSSADHTYTDTPPRALFRSVHSRPPAAERTTHRCYPGPAGKASEERTVNRRDSLPAAHNS
ncbi:hypothetical protein BJV82DRAFT_584727 [Fennellomyces sp. T-0311]|nr:hypothetical protein BJV82DRAFT_584727 [Fennellomyces sp. T-0311]